MGRWAERAKQMQQEAINVVRKDIVSLELGMRVHYQITTFESGGHVGRIEQVGRVELVDPKRQLAVVIPETEQALPRWVNLARVQKYGKD